MQYLRLAQRRNSNKQNMRHYSDKEWLVKHKVICFLIMYSIEEVISYFPFKTCFVVYKPDRVWKTIPQFYHYEVKRCLGEESNMRNMEGIITCSCVNIMDLVGLCKSFLDVFGGKVVYYIVHHFQLLLLDLKFHRQQMNWCEFLCSNMLPCQGVNQIFNLPVVRFPSGLR